MTAELLSLTLDVVFKSLFIKHPHLLINLLNSCLNFQGDQRIKSITIKNSEVLPEEIHKKFIVVDIRATDHAGRKFNIEMQSRGQSFYNKRAAFYLCKVHVGQLEAGKKYDEIKPSYGIHFLNFIQYPEHEQKFHFNFQFREETHPKLVLTDDLSLHLFELPKLRKKDYVGSQEDNLTMVEWVTFLDRASKETEKSMQENYTTPEIQEAYSALQALSADEIERERAETRERILRDEISAEASFKRRMKEGIEQGIGQGFEQAAQNMKAEGLSVETIVKVTGLSAKKIQEL